MSIGLISVYDAQFKDIYAKALYELLKERKNYESISHTGMPTFEQHLAFIERIPYKAWYVIVDIDVSNKDVLGSVYLSYNNEIGIGIFEKERRYGYATDAIKLLIEMHPEKYYLANINPANLKSINLFGKLDFKHIQNTYKFGTEQYTQEDYDRLTGKIK